ncbi:viperin family antiviral radical SAM protein [Desulfoluna limicola]|uniref:viperin family antiviral radical SAM protein n=1 Tax=Desulfoluna limicola TaxID=2810562 RepID=UPI001F2B7E98|nr:viperin family antiviral radical SAM protein [Desulfoluna limicola]
MQTAQNGCLVHSHVPTSVKELVINWHITDECNYRCRYCYSTWKKSLLKTAIHDPKIMGKILIELFSFFDPSNTNNPLRSRLNWSQVRLSIAGGEPLLYTDQVMAITRMAKEMGFNLSLITNGSCLNKAPHELLSNLSALGVSLDSGTPFLNQTIGRRTSTGSVLSINDLLSAVSRGKKLNPDLKLKVNTVVNSINFNQDISRVIHKLKPNKWKVLRVLPVVSDNLTVTEDQFESFVNRHIHFSDILAVEDNQEMTESYLMIDPYGRFFQNSACNGTSNPYIYSDHIAHVGAKRAFSQIYFDASKFAARYPGTSDSLRRRV